MSSFYSITTCTTWKVKLTCHDCPKPSTRSALVFYACQIRHVVMWSEAPTGWPIKGHVNSSHSNPLWFALLPGLFTLRRVLPLPSPRPAQDRESDAVILPALKHQSLSSTILERQRRAQAAQRSRLKRTMQWARGRWVQIQDTPGSHPTRPASANVWRETHNELWHEADVRQKRHRRVPMYAAPWFEI